MASGYAVFANGGFRVTPYFVQRIENALGQTIYRADPTEACEACEAASDGGPVPTANAPEAGGPTTGDPDRRPANLLPPLIAPAQLAPRVISPQNDWLMDDMMSDVIRRGTCIRAGLALHRNDIAGKTGTTNEARDTWFNGFNRHIVATVWVGFDQERPLGEGEEGSRTAVPIWVDFMREALRDQPDGARPMPPGLVTARVSAQTGALATAGDTDTLYETFMEDHMPSAIAGIEALPGVAPPGTSGGPEPLF